MPPTVRDFAPCVRNASTLGHTPATHRRSVLNTRLVTFIEPYPPGKIAGLVDSPLYPLGGILSDSDSDVERW